MDDEGTAAWETMFRLFLTADSDLVPPDAVTAASFCGGIFPHDGPHIVRFKECPGAADPGRHAYARLCCSLKEIFQQRAAKDPDLNSKIPDYLRAGKDRFFRTQDEGKLAALVQASLGASDAALAVSLFMEGRLSDWRRSYSDIVGAGCGNGDRVTPFIERWIKGFIGRGGCGRRHCVTLYGDGRLLSPATKPRVKREELMEAGQAAATATVALPANATCASAPNASAPRCSEQSERISWTAGADTRGWAVEGDRDLAMLSSASSATAGGPPTLTRSCKRKAPGE